MMTDIGTGSGCIAVSLAKNLKGDFSAIDINSDTVTTARINAKENRVEVKFFIDNILNPNLNYEKFDVIVSNPPYIPEIDKGEMEANVLDYEPHLALFVQDENPILFYEKIFKFSKDHLNINGALYFEIHPTYSVEIKHKLKDDNYTFEFINDLQDRERILKITAK